MRSLQYGQSTRVISAALLTSQAEILSADIVLQLLDDGLLLGDDGLDQIAQRNHPDQFPLAGDRQMSNAFLRHHTHARFDVLIQAAAYDVRCHDLLDGRFLDERPLRMTLRA